MGPKNKGKPGRSQKRVPQRDPGPAKGLSRPSPLPDAETSDERLCWRFRHVDHAGPWSFTTVTSEVLCAILTKLSDFESMTVSEAFRGNPGKDYDVTEVPHRDVPGRLDAIGLGDQTRISRFELQGKWRLYGFRLDNVFHVVWWDPEHQIWPTKRK
jgi:hypothetical protein